MMANHPECAHHLFDDLLAAVLLYLNAWDRPGEMEGVSEAFSLLREEATGTAQFTSRERERIFRDAAVREAALRGEPYAEIARRYSMSPSLVSRIAVAGGQRRRSVA
jgi:hypothetical protein